MPGIRGSGGLAVRDLADELAQRALGLLAGRGDELPARCQVVSTVKATMPISSGSQAPCTILVMFAARNIRSTTSSAPPPITTTHSGQRQRVRAM